MQAVRMLSNRGVWNIPRMWEGGECWIIGGGPSIPHEFGVPGKVIKAVQNGQEPLEVYSPYLSPIHDKHVIGVNAAFLLGTWIDLVFFGDEGFYKKNKKELLEFPRPKISCHKFFNTRPEVKFVPTMGGKPKGLCRRANNVCWNGNSGAAAINLAYHLGVKRVYLLGFDMDIGKLGNQHWHRHYRPPGRELAKNKLPFPKHTVGFNKIAKDLKGLDFEIINVSQNSKINVFEKRTVKEILG